MKIAGFAAENMASSHLRVFQWVQTMRERGHDATFYGDALLDLATIDRKFEGCDAVVYGRTHDINRICAVQAGRKVHGFKLVVDTDDLVDDIPRFNFASSAFNNSTGLIRMTHSQYRDADAVTVSTPYLYERTKGHNKSCYIVPNCIDEAVYKSVRFREKEARHRGDIRIYWGGGGGHYGDLLIVKDALLRIVSEYPQVKLVFSNFVPNWAAGLPSNRVFFLPLVPFTAFPKVLAWLCCDIGIAPLTDHPHNRSKSHVKWLDYGMAGVAGVYQDMEAYDSVVDGLTGLKAVSPEDWYERVKLLIDNPVLRSEIARHAKREILARWTVDQWAHKYERMLTEVTQGKPNERFVAQPLIEGEAVACQTL